MTHFTLAQLKRIKADYMVKFALAAIKARNETNAIKREALQKDADDCKGISKAARADIVERDTEGK